MVKRKRQTVKIDTLKKESWQERVEKQYSPNTPSHNNLDDITNEKV